MKLRITCKLFLLSIILNSCSNNPTSNQDQQETDSINIAAAKSFLSLFAEIDPNNLHIYSPTPIDTIGGDKFKGKIIDRAYYHFFEFNENFKKIMENISKDSTYHIFSINKFALSTDKTGLLVRWPSQYDESAIYLFIWDNKEHKIIGEEDLTDGFGDEGWFFNQNAWLLDVNKDNQLDFITRRRDYDQDLDDTTKFPKITDSLFVFIAKGEKYEKTQISIDTNQFQLFGF